MIIILLILFFAFRSFLKKTYLWVLIPVFLALDIFLKINQDKVPAVIYTDVILGITLGCILVPVISVITRLILDFRGKYYNSTITAILLFFIPPAIPLFLFSRPIIINYLTAHQVVTSKSNFFLSIVMGGLILSIVFLCQLFLSIQKEKRIHQSYSAKYETNKPQQKLTYAKRKRKQVSYNRKRYLNRCATYAKKRARQDRKNKQQELLHHIQPGMYKVKRFLMSKNEEIFLHYLMSLIDTKKYYISPQTAYSAFLDRAYTEKNYPIKYTSLFSQKYVDYLICDYTDHFKPICAIELNDPSHLQETRKYSDRIKEKICQSAGIPLIIFDHTNNPNIDLSDVNIRFSSLQLQLLLQNIQPPTFVDCNNQTISMVLKKSHQSSFFWSCPNWNNNCSGCNLYLKDGKNELRKEDKVILMNISKLTKPAVSTAEKVVLYEMPKHEIAHIADNLEEL